MKNLENDYLRLIKILLMMIPRSEKEKLYYMLLGAREKNCKGK